MCGGLVCVIPVCHPQDMKKAQSVHTDLPAPALRLFVLHHSRLLHLSWRQSATFFSSRSFILSLCAAAFIFLRERGRVRSLCPLVRVPSSVFPSVSSYCWPLFSCLPLTLLLPQSRSVPSVLVLSHGPWPLAVTPPSRGDFGTQYSLVGRSQRRGYRYELQTFSLQSA